jgi:2-oxoglutarate ferredoxin oxidoreductase subunit alpha
MKHVETLPRVTIRFLGDSGDGMQLTGTQFTRATALSLNDLSTLPDFPAEIRAPAGTTYGVSGFQIQFSSEDVYTPGDEADVIVAMNPAALKAGLKYLKDNGVILLNIDSFTDRNLKLAKYESNPLEDGTLSGYQVFPIEMTRLTKDALENVELTNKEKDRCKNFFALGVVFWLFNRPLEPTLEWIQKKFAGKPEWIEANTKALLAGRNFADSTELFQTSYEVPHAVIEPGIYRRITGNEAIALGLVAAGVKSKHSIFYGSYPITPASDILQYLSVYKNFDVKTLQAEDEIAAIGAAIGASFAGDIGVTGTSGPGVALKSEFMGLAVMTELPLVILNIQRSGPSTGMPTKTEQADLMQAFFGRSGEAPLPIIAPSSPSDCFMAAYEAVQVATHFMVPVMVLSDLYLANSAEPWKIPDTDQLPGFDMPIAQPGEAYKPYLRNPETLARKWALPGTPGLEHRLGGLEKEDVTGNVSYDPLNHQKMVMYRAEKVKRVGKFVTEPNIIGPDSGDVLVVSWGSTYGAVYSAVKQLQKEGQNVSMLHLRWINPLPEILGQTVKNFKRVVVPELNTGQLLKIIRSEYLVDAVGINKIQGMPFTVKELLGSLTKIIGEIK